MSNKIIKCQILKIHEETGNFIPVSIECSNIIAKRFNIKNYEYSLMLNELREVGRYWLNDNEVICPYKE